MTAPETDLDPLGPAALATRIPVQKVRLEVSADRGDGRVHVTSGDRCAIGSHPANDLVIDDRTVSRFHCELRIEGEWVRLRDLGSLNGTEVDGLRVVEAFLKDGSVIRVGGRAIRCTFSEMPSRLRLSASNQFGRLVGSSPSMRAVFAILERAAASDSTLLLRGETGTGKELAARSVHEASARADGPFVVVDCGALRGALVSTDLFGHLRGAFTGAVADRPGAFELADGGTVFLDEVAELPLDLQTMLLRVTEERTVQPVGASARRAVDVRLVAATHRDLREEVNAGRFRADLYHRMAVMNAELPPLRERPEDIPEVVDALLEGLGVEDGATLDLLRDPEHVARLARAAWPGNVRQLRNHLERAAALGTVEGMPTSDLPADVPDTRLPFGEARQAALAAFERRYLARLVDQHGGNVSRAARAAGLNRTYLHELLRRHGLRGS